MVNGLAQERAYLRQHRTNPVNWLPWGEPALAEAKALNKPILLSIGYSACHWCHVMARESFEDPETAALMNAWFVNVKVDREERPDIDALYIKTLQAMGRRPGWPLTMFLTPDGVPFWGGTYFPREAENGLPSFHEVLEYVSDAYRSDPQAVAQKGRALIDELMSRPSNAGRRRFVGNAWIPAPISTAARCSTGLANHRPRAIKRPFLRIAIGCSRRAGDARVPSATRRSSPTGTVLRSPPSRAPPRCSMNRHGSRRQELPSPSWRRR
jgi:uncharacterized protein YyaL (SSP411 family)